MTLPRGHGETPTARAVGRDGATGEIAGVPGGEVRLRGGVPREIEARGADGKPAAGVQVFLPDITVPVAVTGQDGRFSVVVPVGGRAAFRLLAGDGGSAAGRVAVTDPGPLVARLKPTVASSGRILSAAAPITAPLRPSALVWAEIDAGSPGAHGRCGTVHGSAAERMRPEGANSLFRRATRGPGSVTATRPGRAPTVAGQQAERRPAAHRHRQRRTAHPARSPPPARDVGQGRPQTLTADLPSAPRASDLARDAAAQPDLSARDAGDLAGRAVPPHPPGRRRSRHARAVASSPNSVRRRAPGWAGVPAGDPQGAPPSAILRRTPPGPPPPLCHPPRPPRSHTPLSTGSTAVPGLLRLRGIKEHQPPRCNRDPPQRPGDH